MFGLLRFCLFGVIVFILGSFGECLLINGLYDVFSKNEFDL